MSDSDDQVIKKKQKINDDQSVRCSKMSNTFVQRLLYETQSTDSNQSTQTTQDIADIKIETNNDPNTSNSRHIVPVRVDNKAAERSRLYRERHREEINQRRRDIRQRQQNSHKINAVSNLQNTDEIEQIIQTTSHKQRQQRYYERHKEEINKRKRDSRQKQNVPQSIPATAAERNRKYRERNKQKINERRRYSRQNVQRLYTECNINNIIDFEKITKATPNDQQSLNSSNDNIIQEIAQNFTSTRQQPHNRHHFETTTAAFQITEEMDSWDQDLCLDLIDEFKEHEVLWNTRDPGYYNKLKREAAWDGVSQKFGKTAEELRKKMDSLKASYRREKARVRKGQMGLCSKYESKWFAYKSLQFLDDKEDSAANSQDKSDDEESEAPDDNLFQIKDEPQWNVEDAQIESQVQELVQEPVQEQPVPESQTKPRTYRRRTFKRPRNEDEMNFKDTLGMFADQSAVLSVQKDQYGLFGDYIAEKLRRLDSRTRIIAENRISNVFYELEMELYPQDSNGVNNS